MSLPMISTGAPVQAKFAHETGLSLRLQVFVVVRDAENRVALQRIQGYDGWCLSGENLLLNESPDEAAQRVARSWYVTPLAPKLERIVSFPATGGEDNRWYLVMVYGAQAPAGLKATSDCEEIRFAAATESPEFAMSHEDVWRALGGR